MTGKPLQTALIAVALLVAAALVFVGVKADRTARIGAGYKAKVACSEIFLAGRDADTVVNGDFVGMDPVMKMIKLKIDQGAKSTSAAGPLGLGRARAIYRDGYGCTLANGGRIKPLPTPPAPAAGVPWPEAPAITGKALPYVDYAAVDYALTTAIEDPKAATRAFLVIVDGKLVDERYADGFSKATPFLSWSMGKSVTASLVGAAVLQGYIDINDPAPVPDWPAADKRAAITWNDLLHMQSGLRFGEEYDAPRSDVNRMLFEAADTGAIPASQPADYAPGAHWAYSSGTTNLISRTLREVLESKGVDYYAFAREALFDPIGAPSFVMEPDAAGNFIGSSFVYATARDWAKLGELYLQDGVWNGERLLPEGWAAYVATPASDSDGEYGAHFWLNRDGANGRERDLPGVPQDEYEMAGHEGQYVFIIPDKRMVVVRTGMTREGNPMQIAGKTLKEVYDAVGQAPQPE